MHAEHAEESRGQRGIDICVPVMCVYVSQPLVAASRNHPLLNGVTALVD